MKVRGVHDKWGEKDHNTELYMIFRPESQYQTPTRLELPKSTNHLTSRLKQIDYFL
jgi:hypothetical protein